MKEVNHCKKVVLADFDGTLIKADSFKIVLLKNLSLPFIYSCLRIFVKQFLSNPKIDLSTLKQLLFQAMFSGQDVIKFQEFCNSISKELSNHNNDQLLEDIRQLQQDGYEVYIVSASPANWVKPWALMHNFSNVIATEIEIIDGIVTGRFSSINCKGVEKVSRINSKIDLSNYCDVIAYGNSKDDYPMLAVAHKSYLIKGSKKVSFKLNPLSQAA